MIIDKPWGSYEVLYEDKVCKIKRLIFRPLKRMSLQYHLRRQETWTIIAGGGLVRLEEMQRWSTAGDIFRIAVRQVHRITAGENGLTLIEVQTGESFDEDDIVRLESDYHDLVGGINA